MWLLKATRSILKSFQWARDAADRLVSTAPFLYTSCTALSPASQKLETWKEQAGIIHLKAYQDVWF